jgi:hypothetical protein
MRSSIIFSYIVITFLFVGFSFIVEADFADDFDKELNSLWKPISGIWEIKDGVYNGRAIGTLTGCAILPFEVTDGSVIEARLMTTIRGIYKNASIIFSYVNESEIYLVGYAVNLRRWQIIRSGKEGWNRPGWAEFATAIDGTIQSEKWYSLKIEITGTTINLFVDDDFKVKYTFPNGIPVGKIGLGVGGSDVLFDNVKVIGVEDYFSVNPKYARATTWAKLKELDK